jgi:hypothetical protein
MASAALADLFTLYRFTPGRRIYALRQTRDLLPKRDPVVADIDAAIGLDQIALDLITRWHKERATTDSWPKEVIDLDREHDRLWGALASACESIANGFGPDSKQGAAADRIAKNVFAQGVAPIIHLPFVEQRERTNAWLARLLGEMLTDVDTAGVRPIVDRIAQTNERFGKAIDKSKVHSGLTFAEVRDADAKGQLAFLRVFAIITGKHANNDDERARLLAPILRQNDEIGLLYRRNRKIPDVDPNTGEATEPLPTA